MSDVAIIGLDLAKRVFLLHGSKADGSVAFRLKLPRARVLDFLASQQRCVVAMEACASAHGWGREIAKLGHSVRLIPPIYVKPFVKRQKNDATDAEAIAEAASRPTMRFVNVKSQEQQARAMLFRTRDLLVRQRTQLINALRGHLAEHGVVAPTGAAYLNRLAAAISDDKAALPKPVRELGTLYLEQIEALSARVAGLDRQMRKTAAEDDSTRRLQTMPGVGQITALAGCDLLTISPELLAQLAATDAPLQQALSAQRAQAMDLPAVTYDEASFRLALNEDAMATEKLAEGIRAFCADAVKLEALMV